MKTTIEFLTAVKEKHHLNSDGKLASLLGHTRQSISLLMAGKNFLGDEAALKVADLLEVDPAYVVACAHAEREKNQTVKKLWERIASMAVAASVLLLIGAVSIGGVSIDAQAPALLTQASSGTLYIMSNAVVEYWAIILTLFFLLLWAFPRRIRAPQEPDKLAE